MEWVVWILIIMFWKIEINIDSVGRGRGWKFLEEEKVGNLVLFI